MFTWICPQCGREVPPAYEDCPDCAAKAAASAAAAPPPQPPAEPAPPPQTAPPPAVAQPYYPPAQPQPQPQPRAVGPSHFVLPVWLLTVVFALAFVGFVGGIYWMVQVARGGSQPGTPSASVESRAAKSGTKANPLQRYIEVAGVRFVQDVKKNTMAKFLLINHSEADFSILAANVTVWGRTQKSEEDAEGSFSFTTNLGPLESKELSVPVNTKLQIYELPDWQNVTLDLQITAPVPEASPGSGSPQ